MAFIRFDSQGIVGLIIFVVAWQLLSNSIATTPSCKWSDETSGSCTKNTTKQVINLSEIVALQYCKIPDYGYFAFWNTYQIGLPTNWRTDDTCQQYKCKGGCLQVSIPCENGNPAPSKATYKCVSSTGSSEARVLAVFVYPFFCLFGIFLMVSTKNFSTSQLAAILIIAYASYNIERSINIVRGCDWGQETYSSCGSGENGQVQNSKVVKLDLCQSSSQYAFSPFAINIQNSDKCAYRGCSTSQCLKTESSCPGLTGESHECVAQRAEASASPVDLFFGMALVGFGIALLCIGKRQGEHQPLVDH